jgi:hypothetical protein
VFLRVPFFDLGRQRDEIVRPSAQVLTIADAAQVAIESACPVLMLRPGRRRLSWVTESLVAIW